MSQFILEWKRLSRRQRAAFVAVSLVALMWMLFPLLACGQETVKPVPDERFQEAAPATSISVFGDSFPEVGSHEVLVQMHMYLACLNTKARQPAWVAYKVEESDWDTENSLSRNFSTPRRLRRYCLEPSDYSKSGFELGHLYALQFVTARDKAYEVNYLCAIAAQRPGLNKGPWLKAEERIKERSRKDSVAVIAGQLWESEMPRLRNADEEHAVASHCWILLNDDTGTEAYLFPQTCKRDDELAEFVIEPAALRARVASRWIGHGTEERK